MYGRPSDNSKSRYGFLMAIGGEVVSVIYSPNSHWYTAGISSRM